MAQDQEDGGQDPEFRKEPFRGTKLSTSKLNYLSNWVHFL